MTGIVAHTYPEWRLKLAGQVAHWSTDYSLVKRNQPIKKVIAFLCVSFTLMYANATVKSKHEE